MEYRVIKNRSIWRPISSMSLDALDVIRLDVYLVKGASRNIPASCFPLPLQGGLTCSLKCLQTDLQGTVLSLQLLEASHTPVMQRVSAATYDYFVRSTPYTM